MNKFVVRYEELLVRVQKDYPELRFRAGERFCWRAPRTVVFEQFFELGKGEREKLNSAEHKNKHSLPSIVKYSDSLLSSTENGDNSLSEDIESSNGSLLDLVGKDDDSLLWATKTEQNNYKKTDQVASEPEKSEQNYYCLQLLHEIGHGLLGHRTFRTDVERVKMECAAWEKARELAQKYKIYYDEDFVEDELDTYREWLHHRARCKKCGATRYQDAKGRYRCPMCENF